MPVKPASPRDNVYVHLMHGQDAARCAEAFAAGKAPESTPYGFGRAARHGFALTFSRDGTSRIGAIMGSILRRITGIDVVHALANIGQVRRCDVVWTMTEGEAFAVAMLFALRLSPPRPIVANTVWLVDRWDTIGRARRALYRWLARHISVLTVHSQPTLEPARRYFPRNRVELMRFGINADMFTFQPRAFTDHHPIHIVAAGNDRTRDWDVMLRAFGNDPRFHVRLACRWLTPVQVAPFPNIELVDCASIADYKAALAWADFVAVPMRDNMFSGITVALEAAAMGVPVLSTRTGGVPTYFDDQDIFYHPVGDAIALRDLAGSISAQQRQAHALHARRTFVEQDYSTDALMRQYIALTGQVCASA